MSRVVLWDIHGVSVEIAFPYPQSSMKSVSGKNLLPFPPQLARHIHLHAHSSLSKSPSRMCHEAILNRYSSQHRSATTWELHLKRTIYYGPYPWWDNCKRLSRPTYFPAHDILPDYPWLDCSAITRNVTLQLFHCLPASEIYHNRKGKRYGYTFSNLPLPANHPTESSGRHLCPYLSPITHYPSFQPLGFLQHKWNS